MLPWILKPAELFGVKFELHHDLLGALIVLLETLYVQE